MAVFPSAGRLGIVGSWILVMAAAECLWTCEQLNTTAETQHKPWGCIRSRDGGLRGGSGDGGCQRQEGTIDEVRHYGPVSLVVDVSRGCRSWLPAFPFLTSLPTATIPDRHDLCLTALGAGP